MTRILRKISLIFIFLLFTFSTIGGILMFCSVFKTINKNSTLYVLYQIDWALFFNTFFAVIMSIAAIGSSVGFLSLVFFKKLDPEAIILLFVYRLSIPLAVIIALAKALNPETFGIVSSSLTFITVFSFFISKKFFLKVKSEIKKTIYHIKSHNDRD